MWGRRIHSLIRWWSSCRRRGRSITINKQSTNIYRKTICIIQEMINVNNFRLRDIMRLDRNRKNIYSRKKIWLENKGICSKKKKKKKKDIKLKPSRKERQKSTLNYQQRRDQGREIQEDKNRTRWRMTQTKRNQIKSKSCN